MYIELEKLRRSVAVTRTVSVGVASTEIAPRSTARIGVIISCNDAADVWLSFGEAPATAGGVLMPDNGKPLCLDLWSQPGAVIGPIHAIAPGGAVNLTIVESTLPL